MKVDLLTKECPSFIYGDAGVHVNELAKVLRSLADVRVHASGDPRGPGAEGADDDVTGYPEIAELGGANAAPRTFGVDLEMAQDTGGTDLVHPHTWYASLAGHLTGLLHGVPYVISAHPLEPLRPWKAEQLGGGYTPSSWAEKTAYEAASGIITAPNGMHEGILHCYPIVDPEHVKTVHDGIDLGAWKCLQSQEADAQVATTLKRLDVNPDRPTVVFVRCITRQKGLPHLLYTCEQLPADVQVILCAGASDTPEIKTGIEGLVARLREKRAGVAWIEEMLPHLELITVLAASGVFVCPSVYEPLDIVNPEAIAVDSPVVGSAIGGISDVIIDGEIGLLVPIEQVQDGIGTPIDPACFGVDPAERLATLVTDTETTKAMGRAARHRVKEHFAWQAIAQHTMDVYNQILNQG